MNQFYSTLVPNIKQFPHLKHIYHPRFNKEFFKRLKKNAANIENEIARRGLNLGLDKTDLDYVIENCGTYVKLKDQFDSFTKTSAGEVDAKKWELKDQLEVLEQRLLPIVLKLPNRCSKITPEADQIVEEVKPDRSSLGKLVKTLSHIKLSYINHCYSKSVVGPNSYYYYGIGAKLQYAFDDYFSTRLESERNFIPMSGMCLVRSPVVETTNCRVEKDFATDPCRIISEGKVGSQHLVEASLESLMSLVMTFEPTTTNEPLRLMTSGAAYRAGSDWFDSDTKCPTQYQTTHALSLTSSIENYSMKEYIETKDLLWDTYLKLELPLRLIHLSPRSMRSNEYDAHSINVWLPSKQLWLPVCRVSHYLDYITIRAGMKRGHVIDSMVFDGQVLAAAIIENRQTLLGRFVIPPVLKDHFIHLTHEEKKNYFQEDDQSEVKANYGQPYSVPYAATTNLLLNYEQRRFLVNKKYLFSHSKRVLKNTNSRNFRLSYFLLLGGVLHAICIFDWNEIWYQVVPRGVQRFLYNQLYRRLRRTLWKFTYSESDCPDDLSFDEIDKTVYAKSQSERRREKYYEHLPERQKPPTTVKVD